MKQGLPPLRTTLSEDKYLDESIYDSDQNCICSCSNTTSHHQQHVGKRITESEKEQHRLCRM